MQVKIKTGTIFKDKGYKLKINYFKSIICLIFSALMLVISQPAEAKTYHMIAYTMDKISTTKQIPKLLTLKVPAQEIDGGNIQLEKEVLIRVKVIEINQAKRGKRDGYITTKLLAYTVPSPENETVDLTDRNIELTIKRYSEKDFKGLAKSAATVVVGQVAGIPFLSQGVAAVKGAVKPKEGKSRIKSAGISVYESTPLSYFNKGENLELAIGDKLTLSFKLPAPEDSPNYEYEIQE